MKRERKKERAAQQNTLVVYQLKCDVTLEKAESGLA